MQILPRHCLASSAPPLEGGNLQTVVRQYSASGQAKLALAALQGLDMLAYAAAAKGVSSQPSSQPATSQPTFTLELGAASVGDTGIQDVQSSAAQPQASDVTSLVNLWQQAVQEGQIKECQLTEDIKQMALGWARSNAV